MPLPDLTTLTATEQQALLVDLLRLVAQSGGYEAVRQALLTSLYPTPTSTIPDWLQETTQPEEPTDADLAAADAYLKNVRQRIDAKYGTG